MVMRPALLALSLFLLVLAGPGLARAATISSPSISLRLESDRIVSGDTVVLEIESVGLDAPIDLGPLRDIAAIGRETYGTRIAVIEGKVVEVKLRRIEIVPRETGLVIVGPLSAGAVSSNSQSVTVLAEPPPDWSPGPDDLQLVMRVSKADPHVQEEVILDIELAHRHPLVADEMPVPDLSGLDAVPVHEERRTLDEKAGLRRIAWRYLVWPRRSGALVIPGVSASGEMQKSRLERGAFSVATPPLHLSVRPAAVDSGGWWLPARGLTLSEEWSQEVQGLNAGDEIVRTITVRAAGVRAVQIPDLAMPPARALAITPLGSERKQRITPQGMQAEAIFRFRVRALSPIPVFPDTIRLPWFDTEAGMARESILPARRINVGIPDRDALLLQAVEERTMIGRLAAWLRVTTAPGMMAATSLGLLLAAAGLGLGNRIGMLRQRWHVRRSWRRLVREARQVIRSASPPEAAARLDALCRMPGGTPLRPVLVAAGAAAYGPGEAGEGWRMRALDALEAASRSAEGKGFPQPSTAAPYLPPL